MTLERYWSIIVKHWKLIVASFVLVGLGTYIGSRLLTPVYESGALVRVDVHGISNSADYNNLLASNQLVQTQAILATSNAVLREVATHYPGLTADQLAGRVTAEPKLNTQLFEIDVQDTNASRAAVLANDIAATLVRQQVQEIGQENAQSQLQLQQDINTTSRTIDGIAKKIASSELKIAVLTLQKNAVMPILQLQVTGLQSQLNNVQQHYSQDQILLTQLEMAEAQNSDFLHIAQSAQPALAPVRPKTLLNTLLGLCAGLFMGLTIAMLFEQLDTRIRTSEEVAQLLNWPVLGVIWLMDHLKGEQAILIDPKMNSANAEAYRILRTNFGFSVAARPVRSLVVTSAMPYDGKTTIASNLAVFMAQMGKNTLLIDGDLHHPSLHKKFSLPADAKGLSDAIVLCSQRLPDLSRQTFANNALLINAYMHAVNIPHLRVMPAGSLPPNPGELLASTAMDSFLATIVSSGIEMIIFDSPPLLGLADTSILASKVDGTVVVVDVTRVKRKNLLQVKTLLAQSGTRVLGCVVNKLRRSRNEAPYYYYNHADEGQLENASQNGHSSVLVSSLPFSSRHGRKDQAK